MNGSMTRRGVLTGAAAIAGATALPQFLVPARTAAGHVIVDERLPDSARFASGLEATHVHSVGALNDLCSRWYTQLRRQLQADNGQIAGLTTWMDYVIMRSCAAEIGYRRAFHAEHCPSCGDIEHRVTAQPDLLASLSSVHRSNYWAQSIGQALAAGEHLRSRVVAGKVFTATAAVAAPGHMHMVSWVFAPRT